MAIESTSLGARPQRVILEYVGDRQERIYGFGQLAENGEVTPDEDETFGSFPNGPYNVLKADGTLVSNDSYRFELEGSK